MITNAAMPNVAMPEAIATIFLLFRFFTYSNSTLMIFVALKVRAIMSHGMKQKPVAYHPYNGGFVSPLRQLAILS